MKLILDDVLYTFEDAEEGDQLLQADGPYEFTKFVDMILTPKQFHDFAGNDTRRTFVLSKKKEKLLFDLIKMKQS